MAFVPSKHAAGGLFLSPGIGLEAPAGSMVDFLPEVEYVAQKLRRLKTFEDIHFASSQKETLKHHAIIFKAGIAFSFSLPPPSGSLLLIVTFYPCRS